MKKRGFRLNNSKKSSSSYSKKEPKAAIPFGGYKNLKLFSGNKNLLGFLKSPVFIISLVFFLVLTGIYFLAPGITGFFTAREGMISYEKNIDWVMDSDDEFSFSIDEHPSLFDLRSLKLSGSYTGNGTVKAYLENSNGTRFLIFNNGTIVDEELSGITSYFVGGEQAVPGEAEPDYEIGDIEDEKAEEQEEGEVTDEEEVIEDEGPKEDEGVDEEEGEDGQEAEETDEVIEEDDNETEENVTEIEEEINITEAEDNITEEENISEENATVEINATGETNLTEEINTTETNLTEEANINEGINLTENITESVDLNVTNATEINDTNISETNITSNTTQNISQLNTTNITETNITANISETNITENLTQNISQLNVTNVSGINVSEANITQNISLENVSLANVSESNITEEINITEEEMNVTEENVTKEVNLTEEIVPLGVYRNVEIKDVEFHHELKNDWGTITELVLTVENEENSSIDIKYLVLNVEGYDEPYVLKIPVAKVIESGEEKEVTIQTHFSYAEDKKRRVRIRIKDKETLIMNSRTVVFDPKEAKQIKEQEFNEVCSETCLLPSGLNDTEYKIVFEVDSGLLEINKIDYVLENLTKVPVEVKFNVLDRDDNEIASLIEFNGNQTKNNQTLKIETGNYDAEIIPENHTINRLEINSVNIEESFDKFIKLDQDQVDLDSTRQSYALNPLVEFETASINVTAQGKRLYKCSDWSYFWQSCRTNFEFIKKIVENQSYEVDIDHPDGSVAFIETTVTNATNITYKKVKEDERYEAIIDHSNYNNRTNTLTVVFHHNYIYELPVFVKGRIKNYTLDKKVASENENVTLKVYNWNNERFRVIVGSHSEAFEFGKARELKLRSKVKNAGNSTINARIELIDSLTEEFKSAKQSVESKKTIEEGEYDIKVKPEDYPVKEIRFKNMGIYDDFVSDIRIDDVDETEKNLTDYEEVYAIDPTNLNFTNATVTVTAKGTELYKCQDWNFTTQTCYGNWTLFKTGLVPGENYTFELTPLDPGFGETITDCAAEDEAAKGSFGGSCDYAGGSSLEENDGIVETHTYNKQAQDKYAGVQIESVNTTITDCQNITSVEICYEWWTSDANPVDCDISVDADGGSSYTAVTTTCPGTSANPGVTCTDVTSLESWNCSKFFGASGTRAKAKSENARDDSGPPSTETTTWDVLYFNVSYDLSDLTPPSSVTNLTNQSQGLTWIYWNWTNPADADFNSSIIYIDGVNLVNTSENYYNATGLNPNTNYTITVHTKDNNGNVNNTDVNDTASTLSFSAPTYEIRVLQNVNGWTTVNLENIYTDPIVIVTGQEGADISMNVEASRPMIRNIASSSFQVRVLNDSSSVVEEDVGYLVIEQGHYILDGIEIEAGNFTVSAAESTQTIDYDYSFPGSTVVVDTLQTECSEVVSSRYVEGSMISTSFQTLWEDFSGLSSESNEWSCGTATAGYVAVEKSSFNSLLESGEYDDCSADPESSDWCQITFSDSYNSTPILFTNPLESDGPDSTIVGRQNLNTTGVELRPTESRTADTEQTHAVDDIPWLVWKSDIDDSPSVELIQPFDNYVNDSSDPANVTFFCNATDDNQLKNISLYITNSTNQSFTLNQTTNISGTYNSTNWTLSLNNGDYTWNCLAYDTSGNSDWGNNNRSIKINYSDLNQVPNISNVVLNSTFGTNLTTENLTVYYNASDADNDSVKNITNWYLDGTSLEVLNMPFEGGSNSTFTKDYSGFSNNGSVNGALWNSTGGYDGFGAYKFDGVDDYISMPNSNSLNVDSEKLTLSAWVKWDCNPANGNSWASILSKNGDYQYQLQHSQTNDAFEFALQTSQERDWVLSNTIPQEGLWYYVVGQYNSTHMNIYVNGEFENSELISGTVSSSTSDLDIGRRSVSGDRQFNGTIDDVRIYNRSLSAEQIKVLYENKTELIVSNETKLGEVWKACATPNDGHEDGAEVCSNNLTIIQEENTLPNVSDVILNSTLGTNLTTENLTVYYNASDADNDSVKNITNWYLDGTSVEVLNMPFEGGSNSTFTKDYSGFSNDGSVNGALWNSTGGYDGFGAYKFDGDNDLINAGNDSSLSLVTNLTISTWLKPTATVNDGVIFGKPHTSQANPYITYAIGYSSDGTDYGLALGDSSTQRGCYTDLDTVSLNKWTYFTSTFNGTHVNLYINGELNNSCTFTYFEINQNSAELFLGDYSYFGNTYDYAGYIDDLKIYDKVLSKEQIKALYQNKTDLIVSNETEANDIWKACVTPNDGTEDGAEVCSNNLTIIQETNVLPNVSNVVLNSTFGTNLTSENLTCNYNLSGSSTTTVVNWLRNGSSIILANYPFEGNSTNALEDYSGSSRDLTNNDSIWNSSIGRDGNGAWNFTGTGQYLEDADAEDYINGLSEVTVSAWVKADLIGTDRPIWSTEEPDGDDGVLELRYDVSGVNSGCTNCIKAGIATSTTGENVVQIESSSSVQTTNWQHVVLRWKGSGHPLELFLDGVKDTGADQEGTAVGTISSATTLLIGQGAKGDGGDSWDGLIDDFRIYNVSLSDEQISAIYNNRTDLIVSQETSIGETWACEVTPFSSINRGTTQGSNNLTIVSEGNTFPNVSNVILNSTLGTNLTTENLTVYYDVSDADNDSVKNITNWYLDGTSVEVLNMPFEGGSNSTFTKDYSGFSNNGSVNGALWNSTGGYDGFGAYEFDGADDYIQISDDNSLNVDNQMSVEVWFNPLNIDDFGRKTLVSKDGFANTGWSFFHEYYNNGSSWGKRIRVEINGDLISPSEEISEGAWQHAIFTYDGSEVKVYYNGDIIESNSNSTYNLSSVNNLRVGGFAGGGNHFNGTIDDVRIYNRSLSAEQISALYNNKTDVIVSQETEANDTWKACVTPNDGHEDGNQSCSNNLTVLDLTVPQINFLLLNSTFGTNLTTENLTVYSNISEPNYKAIYDWRIDNVSFAILNMPFEGLDGDETTFVKDYSTYKNNGTLGNGTSGTEPAYNSTGGYDNYGAYEFDGKDDIIKVNNDTEFNISDNEFSIFAWINPKQINDYNRIVAKSHISDTPPYTMYGLMFDDSQHLRVELAKNGIQNSFNGNTIINTSQWQHVGFIYDGLRVKVYLNGKEEINGTLNAPIDTNQMPLTIGASGFNDDYFNGSIDDVLVLNRALSLDQVEALYNSRSDFILSQETHVGENWSVLAVPNNGTDEGKSNLSNILTVVTDDIIPPKIILNKPEDNSYTNLSSVVFNWTAIDSDPVMFCDLRVDGEIKAKDVSSLNNTAIASTVDYLRFNYNHTWNVTCEDQHNNINTSETRTFTVSNQIPTQDSPVLSLNVNDDLVCNPENIQDGNNDTVKNIIQWYINDSKLEFMNMPFENDNFRQKSEAIDYANGNNGTLVSAVWNRTGGYDGRGAYEFDAIDDYIDFSSTDFGDEFTFTAWIRPYDNGLSNSAVIASISGGAESGFAFWINNYNSTNANLEFYRSNGSGSASDYMDGEIIWEEWQHIAFAYNNTDGTVKLYHNGQDVTTPGYGNQPNINTSKPFLMGAHITLGSKYNGTIDDVRIYKRILGQEHIQNLYENKTNQIASNETNINETWSCEIIPNDGKQNGETKESNNLTISELPASVGIDLIYPTIDINATQNKFFNVTLNVSCNNANCGNINVSLDPVTWWNSSWNYRKSHVIEGSSDGILTDYQMKIVAYKSSGSDSGENVYLGNNVNDDFSDVRFIWNNTELNFTRDFLDNGNNATFWIEIPSLPASPNNTTIYVYYGNSDAQNKSSIKNTFVQAVDFSSDTLESYGGSSQDGECNNEYSIDNESNYLRFGLGSNTANCWKAVNVGSLSVTSGDYAIAMWYKSDSGESEISGIGHDTETSSIEQSKTYQTDGSQAWGITDITQYDRLTGGWQYLEAVLDDYTGAHNYLTIVHDDDAGGNRDDYFKNIRVRKYTANEPTHGSWSTKETSTKGIIPVGTGNPFYTNKSSNPFTINLNQNQNQIVTFWVNATGPVGATYEFFAYANLTSNASVNNQTEKWNVTIVGAIPSVDEINITSIKITPDDDEITEGAQINPIEENNVSVNLAANLTNTSAVDKCKIRIWNGSGSYSVPTLDIVTGEITKLAGVTVCNATWNMEYWRNPGDWNVSVDVNLTSGESDNENSSFYYNTLIAHSINTSHINFSGAPGQTINSSTAFPVGIKNTGNTPINISISGNDFIGISNSSFNISIENASYSDTSGGVYTSITSSFVQINALNNLNPRLTDELFFRGTIPLGTKSQFYNNTINIKSD